MRGAILARELERVAADGRFGAALFVHAAWLAAFFVVWGRPTGVQLFPGMTTYEQLVRIEWPFIALLLPWTAVRSIANERGDRLVRTAAWLGLRPSRVLAPRVGAVAIALACVVAGGLPFLVVAQRMSNVPIARVVGDLASLAASGVVVAAIAVALQQALANRVVVWLLASAGSIGLVMLVRSLVSTLFIAIALTGIGVMLTLLLSARADSSLQYLSERAA